MVGSARVHSRDSLSLSLSLYARYVKDEFSCLCLSAAGGSPYLAIERDSGFAMSVWVLCKTGVKPQASQNLY